MLKPDRAGASVVCLLVVDERSRAAFDSRALLALAVTRTQTSLLIVDEIGYLSYDSRNADLLFQVISRRHEKKSLVLTTNLAFSDWPTIFPNAGSAIALIHPSAAGIDVGSTSPVVAVPRDRDEQPVRTFRTFSGDLYDLAEWLGAVGITTVAMEDERPAAPRRDGHHRRDGPADHSGDCGG